MYNGCFHLYDIVYEMDGKQNVILTIHFMALD